MRYISYLLAISFGASRYITKTISLENTSYDYLKSYESSMLPTAICYQNQSNIFQQNEYFLREEPEEFKYTYNDDEVIDLILSPILELLELKKFMIKFKMDLYFYIHSKLEEIIEEFEEINKKWEKKYSLFYDKSIIETKALLGWDQLKLQENSISPELNISSVIQTWSYESHPLKDERTYIDPKNNQHYLFVRKLSFQPWNAIETQKVSCTDLMLGIKYCVNENIEYTEHLPDKVTCLLKTVSIFSRKMIAHKEHMLIKNSYKM